MEYLFEELRPFSGVPPSVPVNDDGFPRVEAVETWKFSESMWFIVVRPPFFAARQPRVSPGD